MSNPYSPPSNAIRDSIRSSSEVSHAPRIILLWAGLGILFHGLLTLLCLAFSWVPWIIPFRFAQVFVSLVGLVLHAIAFSMTIKHQWRYPQFLKRAGGTPYLLVGVIFFVGSYAVAGSLVRRDETRFQQHLDLLDEIRARPGLDSEQ